MSSKKSATAKKARPAKTAKPTATAPKNPRATAEPAAQAKGAGGTKAAKATPADAVPSGPRPTRITAAAVLAAAEAVVLVGMGVYVLIMGLTGDPESPQQAEMLGVTVLALAVLPLAAARGLWLRRRWSRGPAMITQLMALPVAWTLVQNGGGLIAVGVVTAVAAFAVLALLINPTATEALGIGPRDA
ncbi:hypothetical protein [Streptomyces sp. ME19-01-6]|uniref:hypothetical protein n=1 Tax=Streptomyces sp. ME19-01-6 TaxID=3028686 RepID=UPI0029B88650|nr:hypothetical protein [Streptomyces sp. ME19-01-6]MDX3225653.1 hypothetical protein [Streptomyces sp. ME19-01-6]